MNFSEELVDFASEFDDLSNGHAVLLLVKGKQKDLEIFALGRRGKYLLYSELGNFHDLGDDLRKR
jgi:hypothetical protein